MSVQQVCPTHYSFTGLHTGLGQDSAMARCSNHQGTELRHCLSFSSGGYSQQCCYNSNGFLATGPPGGGNVDLFSPDIGLLRHFLDDVIPYLLCCKAERFSKCTSFYEKRPSDRGFDFSPPRPPGETIITSLLGIPQSQ